MRQARSKNRRPLLLAELERRYLDDYELFGGLLFFHGMRMLTQRVIPKEFASFMLLTTGKKYDR
jgi:hypothetical protein